MTERCTAIAWTGKPERLIVRCCLEAGHPRSHIEDPEPPSKDQPQ